MPDTGTIRSRKSKSGPVPSAKTNGDAINGTKEADLHACKLTSRLGQPATQHPAHATRPRWASAAGDAIDPVIADALERR